MFNVKFNVFFLVICLSKSLLFAQFKNYHTKSRSAIREFNTALSFYDQRMYTKAIYYFEKAIQIDNKFIEAYQMLALIYEETKNFQKAIQYYERVNELKQDFYINNYYTLAHLYFYLGNYEKAKQNIDIFLSYENRNPEITSKAIEFRKNVEFALQLKNDPVPFNPINLGEAINSQYSEYSMTLTADELTIYFTRLRPRDEKTLHHHQYEEDFYFSTKVNDKWSEAKPLGFPINTSGNEGAGTISPDGKIFIFTACNRKDGYGSCDLYISRWHINGWSEPENLGEPINSKYWESQPSLASDAKTLFFVSNRNGNEDIYVSKFENNVWSVPVNLGSPINTPKKENSPFIHPDGKTLYFMSNGHPGLGGMDIFVSRLGPDGKWSEPKNIGYPINSHADEGFFFVGASGRKAYFASDRLHGYGKYDIFEFELPDHVKPETVTYMRGKIIDAKTNVGISATIELINLENLTTEVLSYSDYAGNYLVPIPINRNFAFNVMAKNYLFYSESFYVNNDQLDENYEYVRNIYLQPIEIGKSTVLQNIYFDYDSDILRRESIAELDKLVEFLKINPTVHIEISGHTDNIGSRQYNQKLSENRAKAVYLYLIENGINPNRLSYKGYADTRPIASNDTDIGRAKNRRTEIVILKK